MKILITGTHFTPAQAVIEQLLGKGQGQRVKGGDNLEIVYVGRKHTQEGDKTESVESQVLPKLGVKFIPIVAGRFRRILDLWTIIAFLKIPVGFVQAFYILVKEQPDVILSFGGYVGLPVSFWAWFLSIPVMLHEQTLVSGLANKISSIFADRIAVSFESDYTFSKQKTILTGNPIRAEILNAQKPSAELNAFFESARSTKLPIIYITGGNQGSHTINEVIFKILDKILAGAFVIHQTGGSSKFNDFEKSRELKGKVKFSERYLASEWFDAFLVSNIYKNATLVISRAGINTLTELAYFGIPTIVVPLPFLYKNEQMVNAKFFQSKGLCQIIRQSQLSEEVLLSKINQILKNEAMYTSKAKNAKEALIPDAARKITLETLILAS